MMEKDALLAQLQQIFCEYLALRGIELVELSSRFEGQTLMLQLLVDRPSGGIVLDECAGLNKALCALLEERDLIPQSYVVEVSSPGLDRPLRTRQDFLRCLNKKVKCFLREPINGKIEWDGFIREVSEQSLKLETGEAVLDIPLAVAHKAKQLF
jgi:ribosome maturation factor RimP